MNREERRVGTRKQRHQRSILEAEIAMLEQRLEKVSEREAIEAKISDAKRKLLESVDDLHAAREALGRETTP
jgi:molecular chaperone GrpE (heat shock protein)